MAARRRPATRKPRKPKQRAKAKPRAKATPKSKARAKSKAKAGSTTKLTRSPKLGQRKQPVIIAQTVPTSSSQSGPGKKLLDAIGREPERPPRKRR